jgi:hypothetical protein
VTPGDARGQADRFRGELAEALSEDGLDLSRLTDWEAFAESGPPAESTTSSPDDPPRRR